MLSKRIPFVLSLVLFSISIASAQQTVTIAEWNIKGLPAVTNARADRIADAIRSLNPDLIVLEEVNPEAIAQRIKDHLPGYTLNFRHQVAIQSIVILSKTASVSVSNPRLIPRSDNNNPRLRKALAADVRIGQFDFLLIGVHMKASRDSASRSTRTRQARAIASFITEETQGNEKDVLLIGDYNMIPGPDNANFRAISPGNGSNEFLRFVSTEALSGQVSDIHGCSGGDATGQLLDGYAISADATGEYVDDSLKIINFDDSIFGSQTCSTYSSRFSDHLPLVARFRIDHDDD